MNYIVLDMEWNQPYSTKATAENNVQLSGEIIQIGAVKLDEEYNTLDTFKIMISPKYYKKMHRYVAKITKITTEELQNGLSFPFACEVFRKWCGEDFVFLTWGPDDVGILRENIAAYSLDGGWIPETYDVQMIFADRIINKKQQVALSTAMKMIDEPALTAHDALNDAKNTACIWRYLHMANGLESYEALRKSEKEKKKKEEENRDVREYDTRKMFLLDAEFISFSCPYCGAKAECIEYVRQNSEKYICIGRCENGDESFVRYKVRRLDRKKYRVSRMIYQMDEENREYYRKKRKTESHGKTGG